ncbi:hypothetical protein WICPIJ_009437 [Wickerhamomyces pijperi]|uniref:GH16 domain-containing protein n=1 Tax=Wickerhamomyces pijperi TaxID=599730 RepID=A0A9P8PMM2_WICPI|nr:hypothetical protein WICPIJ_009437 [Wickerhamomyces pijperi]
MILLITQVFDFKTVLDYSPERNTYSSTDEQSDASFLSERNNPFTQANESQSNSSESTDYLSPNYQVSNLTTDVNNTSASSRSNQYNQTKGQNDSSYASNLSSILPRSTSAFNLDKYTRYPPSRAVSGVFSLNSSTQLLQDHANDTKTSLFTDAELSPFGGFPASQFPMLITEKEDDDYLHNPDPTIDSEYEKRRFLHDLKAMDKRSWSGLFGLSFLFIGAAMVFIVLPVLTYSGIIERYSKSTDVVEVLSLYQYPTLGAIRTSLVDPDTPESAHSKVSNTGETWDLVFSDEFNAEGRTFYDGDDQFWTAPNFHYDATKDLEWYDPDAVTTSEGTAVFTMDAFHNHNLFYRSGMLQSWNKLCFTQGKLEVSARLPNYGNITGLWPGIWTLGNLARPGYLATTDGVWPYSYESCDAGITANQSSSDGISYLKGQKLNACTCDGEDHPNQGTGRGAPEIDALEGATDTKIPVGVASQSYQVAPYDIWYIPDYNYIEIYNYSVTTMNTYTGGPFQQAISGVSTLNNSWYQLGNNTEQQFQTYGFEYENDNDEGYCTWFVGDDPTYTLYAQALHPNGNVDWRRISKEPMSIIMNLGISNNWAYIDWPSIRFPATLQVDYVRIYQPKGQHSITCDPSDHPTSDYIEKHENAYNNANLTSWEDAGSLCGCTCGGSTIRNTSGSGTQRTVGGVDSDDAINSSGDNSDTSSDDTGGAEIVRTRSDGDKCRRDMVFGDG